MPRSLNRYGYAAPEVAAVPCAAAAATVTGRTDAAAPRESIIMYNGGGGRGGAAEATTPVGRVNCRRQRQRLRAPRDPGVREYYTIFEHVGGPGKEGGGEDRICRTGVGKKRNKLETMRGSPEIIIVFCV